MAGLLFKKRNQNFQSCEVRGHVVANIISLLDTPSLCISFAICSWAASGRTRLPDRSWHRVGKAAGRAPSPRLGGQLHRCRARSLWRRGPGAAYGHRRFLARAHARPPQPPSRRPHLRGRRGGRAHDQGRLGRAPDSIKNEDPESKRCRAVRLQCFNFCLRYKQL